jgi:transcriptional regulator with XRE-family HTH domain
MCSVLSEPLTAPVVEDTVSIRMSWQEFGEEIRKLREQRGLSREALAEKCGLSAVYLKKLEAGDRLTPTLQTLDRIARALDASLRIELTPRRKPRGGRHGRPR